MIFYFHRGEHIISKLIRFFTMGEFNHCSVRIGDFVYESHLDGGVKKTHISDWDNSTVARLIDVDVPHPRIAKKFAEEQLGKKYDTLGVLSFIWTLLQPKKDRWYCSEYAKAICYKAIGIDSTDPAYHNRVSPTQFWYDLQDLIQLI